MATVRDLVNETTYAIWLEYIHLRDSLDAAYYALMDTTLEDFAIGVSVPGVPLSIWLLFRAWRSWLRSRAARKAPPFAYLAGRLLRRAFRRR